MSRIAPMRPIFAKTPQLVSKPMRANARGQRCELMLDCCNHDPETTVLAHLRMFGWAGMAEKPHDFLAVFACSACHDALDHRGSKIDVDPWDVVRALGNTLIRQYEAHLLGETP